MKLKPIFIYLRAFSGSGGIEKFNKCFMKSLLENFPAAKAISLYDNHSLLDEDYFPRKNFIPATNNRLFSSLKIILSAAFSSSKILIFGHINLAPLALIIHKISPKKKLILIAHGIDVWGNLSKKKIKFLQKVNQIWAVSSYTKQRLVTEQGISTDKVKIFPNTIDPYFNKPKTFDKPPYLIEKYGLKENDKIIYTLCRISSKEAYKGYDSVIEALPEIIKNYPETKYFMAGKYDTAEKNRIETIAIKFGVKDKIRFLGFVKEKEITDHYLLADVFVMPSKNEGFGIVYLEAMLCGLPVIAGNKDGSVDALQNGKLGTLIDPENIEQIANAINENLNSTKTEVEKTELQKEVLECFGFDKFKGNLKYLIERVI